MNFSRKILLLFSLCLIGHITIAQSQPDDWVWNKAEIYYQHGKYDSASQLLETYDLASFSEILKLDLHNFLGKCYKRNYELVKAKRSFKLALQLNRDAKYKEQFIQSQLGLGDIHALNFHMDSVYSVTQLLSEYFRKGNSFTKYKGHYLFNLGKSFLLKDTDQVHNYFNRAYTSFDRGSDEFIILLKTLAEVHIKENKTEEGLKYVHEALDHLKSHYAQNKLLKSDVFMQLGHYHHMKGHLDSAISIYSDSCLASLQTNQTIGARFLKSEVYMLIGKSYHDLGDLALALSNHKKNLVGKKKLLESDHFKIGESLFWLADLYYDFEMRTIALGLIHEAKSIFEEHKGYEYLGECFLIRGLIFWADRNYNQSIEENKLALKTIKKTNLKSFVKVTAKSRISNALLYLNRPIEARVPLEESIAEQLKVFGETPRLGRDYYLSAGIFSRIQKLDSATLFYEKALKVFEGKGIKRHFLLGIGLHKYLQFLNLHKKYDKIEPLIIELMNVHSVEIKEGKPDFSNYDLSRATWGMSLSCTVIAEYYYNQYTISSDISQLDLSVEYMEMAIKVNDNRYQIYSYWHVDQILHAWRYKFMYVRAIRNSIEQFNYNNDTKYLNEAFEIANRSKSSRLLSHIREKEAMSSLTLPDSLRRREANLRDQIIHLESKLIYAQNANEEQSLKEKKINTQLAYEELMKAVEERYSGYRQQKNNFEPVSVKDVQSNLKEGEALIEYFSNAGRTYAFTLTRDSIYYEKLKHLKRKDIQKYRDVLNPDFMDDVGGMYYEYTSASSQLYNDLLAQPLEGLDLEKIHTLRIIPDGLLGLIPFETLLTDSLSDGRGDYSTLPYLFKKFNVSYGYSSSVMYELNQKQSESSNKDVLAFASGDLPDMKQAHDLLPLKCNSTEVLNIPNYVDCTTSVGVGATELNFKKDIGNYNIAHLAMHAVINDEDPMYSKLLFSPSQDTVEDGALHAFELYNMKLNTEMVVLSASIPDMENFKYEKG